MHKVTWVSPDGITENQIDHIAISRKWRGSLLDVRNRRGADAGSDHHLLVGTIRLKVAAVNRKQDPNTVVQRRFDTRKLQNEQTRHTFTTALRSYHDATHDAVCDKWQNAKHTFTVVAKEHIGYPEPYRKQWISDDTWELIIKRKQAKNDVNSARTRISKTTSQEIYNNIHKHVKRSARRDKRIWTENLAKDAENAAATNRSRDLYTITKKLCRPNNTATTMPLKDKNGNLAVKIEDQLNIWHDHYKLLLSPTCNNTTFQCSFQHHNVRSDMKAECPNISEVLTAISKMKNFKAPGLDNISPELLKADPETSAKIILPVIEEFWTNETLPEELKEGVIINIPKKGNLTECKNWRGITLLSLVIKMSRNNKCKTSEHLGTGAQE